VLDEIDRKLEEKSRPDYITLSGSGEPTLHARLAELVAAIKERTDIPLAVLTNGSMLWDPAVREALSEVDLVVPSLDAGDAKAFRRVNRPHRDLSFERMLEGLTAFGARYGGRIWLEVFLVGELTGRDVEVEKIAALVGRIRPERIQLNTVTRPPAEKTASAVPEAMMLHFAEMFENGAEIIADFDRVHEQADSEVGREALLNLLKRRPCSLKDIVRGLQVHPNEVLKRLEDLIGDGAVTTLSRNETTFYVVKAGKSRERKRKR
jgi:wyosine [tRNA(Phe)-imidazoG37] synthetase (radical SAM superfamily)